MAPIPITIITGFLGSGKTTLILNLLPQLQSTNPNYRLALLKNEFGDLAVDSQLASASAISGVQELLNGCICCNLVGQLAVALAELTKMDPKPDRIVIETSGSAFPATLAIEVNRLARTTGEYVLDGVVSVIDVENWKGYEDTSYTAKVQVKYTDLIVFNKWEGQGERRFDEVLDRVGDLEVDVAWVKSRKGWVDSGVVFGVDGALARELEDGEEHRADGGHGHGDEHKHGHGGEDHHTQEVEVLSVTLHKEGPDAAIDAGKLIGLLKAAPKDEVYRIKAVLTVAGVVVNSDEDVEKPDAKADETARWILNWAFGRWTFTKISGNGEANGEHESSDGTVARMTLILARYESAKWTKKVKEGGFLELSGEEGGKGEVAVERIS
ncbi:putative GTP-binding protein YjiA [Zalerion maritima]|uniref:GTP-binding protein YjiA n=1 Tax=Zalerion maritima TaxID=339359 RepID=A0AAD5WVX7_9PEZI|nr:putative GTP-binding protein YjiA [Zalerion maritima]